MKSQQIFFGIIIFVAFVLISVIFYGYQVLQTPNFQVNKSEKYLYIKTGTKFPDLLEQLKAEEIVHDPLSFAFLSKLLKYQEAVKPGKYLIKANMNNLEAVRMLRAGLQSPVKVTFNNIRLLEDFCERVSEPLEFSATELLDYLKQPQTLKKYQLDEKNIITLFLPNTYEFYWDTSPEDFVAKLAEYQKKFWNKARLAKADSLGLSPQKVSILASIVQAETSKNDEKPRIAGVYLNRLAEETTLNADPTLVFAHRDFSIRRVLNKHKAIDSPYNTYKYPGLPPGPINMPSEASLLAVLDAEQHDFQFFCARADFSGYHAFAKTYAEHLRNARAYQRALDEKGIKQ